MITTHCSRLDGGIVLLERHYPSQHELACAVLESWVACQVKSRQPLWRHYAGTSPLETPETDNALALACQRLQGIIDPQCQAMVDTVTNLARSIARQIMPPPSLDVHRIRTTGRSGYALNIHKVNRGQLSTAWKRTLRENRLGETGIVTLVLCTDYSSNAISPTAQYTMAATLALAAKIEETGRRCEIWASILTHQAQRMRQGVHDAQPALVEGCPPVFDELDHLVVKRATESLQAPAVAALCSLSYVRSLFFQIWRMHRDTIGPMRNYGSATNKGQVLARLAPYLVRQGIPLPSVRMGADETDNLTSQAAARAWVIAQLATLRSSSATATA